MNRARRAEIVRSVYRYCAAAVRDLADVDGGLYEELADINTEEGQEETALVISVVNRIALALDERGES